MLQGFLTWQVTDNPELGLFRVKLTRNAQPFLVTYGVSSALSRRFADYTSKWFP
jgi:hypothetical protein